MSSVKHLIVAVVAVFALFFGSVREVRAGVVEAKKDAKVCRDLPVIKNMTGLKAQHVCEGMTPKALTRADIKKLAILADSPEEHLTIARFYRAEANGRDTTATEYERVAATLRNAPVAKNLAAPGTASRYEFGAKGLREEANEDYAVAAIHEKMATGAIASLR